MEHKASLSILPYITLCSVLMHALLVHFCLFLVVLFSLHLRRLLLAYASLTFTYYSAFGHVKLFEFYFIFLLAYLLSSFNFSPLLYPALCVD